MSDAGRHRVRGAAALSLMMLATHASAMVLCATRKGDVVADARCRRREVQLDARDLGVRAPAGLPGPAGPAGPAGAPVERPFRIVDADGATACTPLASDGSYLQCVLEPDAASAPVQLVLRRDGSDPERPLVFYDAPGCQGPPFVREPPAPIARATPLGSRLLIPSGSLAPLAARSSEQVGEQCTPGPRSPDGTCCTTHDPPVAVMAAPARRIDLSTLGLRAPLRGEDR